MLWDHNFQMLDFREEENDEEVKIFGFLGLFYFWFDDYLVSWKERNSSKLVPFYMACDMDQHISL